VPAPIPAAALYHGYRFSTGDHQLRSLAVPALFTELAGCRGAPGRTGRDRRPGDKLHLDEVALKINGRRHWLWRAVDQHGFVVDILVQSRRDQHAAEAFIRRAVGGWDYTPRVVITDKLASYPPALRRVLPNSEHRRHKGLNNRAENSHLPTRQRERRMQRFKSAEQAQRFLEPFSSVCNHFRPRRHRLTATAYRRLMDEQRQTWREVTAVPAAR